jgi:hypothetical protein
MRCMGGFVLPIVLLAGCSTLLPNSKALTEGPWQSFEEAQQVFDRIVPYKTTADELKQLNLDPAVNSNITILNYSDVLRRFIPSPSIDAKDLDTGVQECIAAKTVCKGYEVDQHSTRRDRYGSFWLDLLNFRRKVDIVGWRFNGVILMRNGTVVYKLTGGQPAIHEHEESTQPLGPFQSMGESSLLR